MWVSGEIVQVLSVDGRISVNVGGEDEEFVTVNLFDDREARKSSNQRKHASCQARRDSFDNGPRLGPFVHPLNRQVNRLRREKGELSR